MWRFWTRRLFLLSGFCMRDTSMFLSFCFEEHSSNNSSILTRYCGLVQKLSGGQRMTQFIILPLCHMKGEFEEFVKLSGSQFLNVLFCSVWAFGVHCSNYRLLKKYKLLLKLKKTKKKYNLNFKWMFFFFLSFSYSIIDDKWAINLKLNSNINLIMSDWINSVCVLSWIREWGYSKK